MLGRSQLEN